MDNLQTIKNWKYFILCIGICVILLILPCFKGKLYLSSNGYLVLNHLIGGPDWKEEETRTYFGAREKFVNAFEMIVNGDHLYWMYKIGEGYYKDGVHIDKFFILSDAYGVIEFHAWRTPETLYYKIADNIYIRENIDMPHKLYKNMDMIAEFMEVDFWYPGYQAIRDYHYINEGRVKKAVLSITFVVLLQVILLWIMVFRMSGGEKRDTIHRKICCIIFGILQLLILWIDLLNYVMFL